MRLYLSSYRIGDRAGSLLALLGNGRHAAIIENALDNISPTARDLYRAEAYDPVSELGSLGIAGTPLDLRDHFGDPEGLRARLSEFDLVWVTGGNAFVLRRAMKQSGFDEVIVDMLDNDHIVYGGLAAERLQGVQQALPHPLALQQHPSSRRPSASPGLPSPTPWARSSAVPLPRPSLPRWSRPPGPPWPSPPTC